MLKYVRPKTQGNVKGEKYFSHFNLPTFKEYFLFFLSLCHHPVTLVKNNGKFGEKLKNGTLTGALGNLQRRQADIVTTAFFVKV